MSNGKLVVFEGIDGSGKSTQCKLLYDRLVENGTNTTLVREPGGTETGEHIRKWLSSGSDLNPMSEFLLFSAARSALLSQKIQPALNMGHIVISDRYMYSSIAYQSFGRGIAAHKIRTINQIVTDGLDADIVFLIDTPPEISLKRIRNREGDRFEKETMQFHKKVRKGFKVLANQDESVWFTIDGETRTANIHELIWNKLQEKSII